MISLQKWKILTPLQQLPNNVGDLAKLIVAKGFKNLPKVQKLPNLVTLKRPNRGLPWGACRSGQSESSKKLQKSEGVSIVGFKIRRRSDSGSFWPETAVDPHDLSDRLTY